MTKRYYAGIGSRETPQNICCSMTSLAQKLEDRGWILRSGHADRADMAFEMGVLRPENKEIFLPWLGFNYPKHEPRALKPGHYYPPANAQAWEIAERTHPAWNRCSQGAKNLHVRNVYQIMGADLHTRVDAVVCWTPGARSGGGTGQAIRLAQSLNIPVFDVCDPHQVDNLNAFFNR